MVWRGSSSPAPSPPPTSSSTEAKPSAAVATRVHEGLLGWDVGWYETIARHGYAGAGHVSLRFFPSCPC